MKFAHYLSSLNRDSPDEWRDKFLKYKLLKKLLKSCSPDQPDIDVCEARFFDELRVEMDAANRHFACNADKIIDAFHELQSPSLCAWLFARRSSHRKSLALAERAYWCRKYAKANAVALRKILKKHDKCCRNTAGREFLQECWRSDGKQPVGLFLHSPLLDELKAIQAVLQSQAALAPEDPNLVERAPFPASAKQKQQQQEGGNLLAAGTQLEQPGSGQKLHGALSLGLGVKAAAPAAGVARCSMDSAGGSQSGHSADCSVSYTSPSLRQQRERALSAIVESPTCMLDTGDFEWCCAGEPGGSCGAAGAASPKESHHGGCAAAAAAATGGHAGVGAARRFREEDLKCPICLDIMYKPVGLGCGHKFCRQCALEAAGFGRAVGAFFNIVSHIPLRTGCPQCRQTGVYRNAVSLREVGKLIKARYPEVWAERRAEDKARQKQQQQQLATAQPGSFQHMLNARNAFDLLFTM